MREIPTKSLYQGKQNMKKKYFYLYRIPPYMCITQDIMYIVQDGMYIVQDGMYICMYISHV